MDNIDQVQNSAVEVDEKVAEAPLQAPKPPVSKVAAGTAKPTARATTQTAAKKAAEAPPPDPTNKLRRRIVWACIWGYLAANFLMFLRFFLPRSIFEPSTTFRIGYPQDFALGVDTKFQQSYRIWVVRNAERLFVVYARCTHLGCTPDWKASEQKFKCPCHGSGYDSEAINFEGPAPRPMDRAHVELDPEGQIVVDINRLYKQEKGKQTQFDDPGAYLRV
jgi:cytochrome b6-f complex iron-sulfur subunit